MTLRQILPLLLLLCGTSLVTWFARPQASKKLRVNGVGLGMTRAQVEFVHQAQGTECRDDARWWKFGGTWVRFSPEGRVSAVQGTTLIDEHLPICIEHEEQVVGRPKGLWEAHQAALREGLGEPDRLEHPASDLCVWLYRRFSLTVVAFQDEPWVFHLSTDDPGELFRLTRPAAALPQVPGVPGRGPLLPETGKSQ